MANPHYHDERENNVRILWPGDHKNAIYCAVERTNKHCWTVTMRDRYVYGVTVTDTRVSLAFHRAMRALTSRL